MFWGPWPGPYGLGPIWALARESGPGPCVGETWRYIERCSDIHDQEKPQENDGKPSTPTGIAGLDDPDMAQDEVDPEIEALENRIRELEKEIFGRQVKEDIPMDDIDEFEFGKLNLLDSLTEEEKLAFEIMQQMDSGDITEEEGEERLADIARELEIAGKQATLQSNFLTRYLNKSCKIRTTIKLKKPATQLTNHINIKF